MEPVRDGYTVKVLARSSTCSFCLTAMEIGKISSDALGPTTTPPITVPEPFRAKIFTKPSLALRILARALLRSESLMMSAWYLPDSISASDTPTLAISGDVKMFDATWWS